jgi:hypothetical protein
MKEVVKIITIEYIKARIANHQTNIPFEQKSKEEMAELQGKQYALYDILRKIGTPESIIDATLRISEDYINDPAPYVPETIFDCVSD